MFTLAEPKSSNRFNGREPLVNTVRLSRSSGPGPNKGGYQPGITISADIAARMGIKKGDRYNILIGSGADTGRVAIQPTPKGRNKFQCGKAGKAITLKSMLIPMREGKHMARDVTFAIEGGCLVIDIPLDLRASNMAVAAE